MKICIPTEEQKGLESMAYGHFGSAPFFVIYDTLTNDFEVLNNGNSEHEHGQCNPIQPLREKAVEAVVVAGMGARALMNLNNMGIQVFRTSESKSIKEIISGFDMQKMQRLTVDNSCSQHNCH
ncbi:MAG: NifB/NifX family molybdenum-iron cluster-binding protein [bacterium]